MKVLSSARWGILLAGVIASLAFAAAFTSRAHGAEAERLTVVRGGGSVAVERGRSGGKVLVLTGAPGAKGTVVSPGGKPLGLVVRVAGCRGLPRLVVSLNRTVVLNTIVRTAGWHRVVTPKAVKPGRFTLTVRLANQAPGKCRRAIRIDSYAFGAGPSPSGSPAQPGGSTGAGAASVVGSAPAAAWWRPAQATTWQWQLSGSLDMNVPAQMYDVDLFDRTAVQIAALKARGAHTVCYMNAGALESRRSDASSFPAAVLGNTMSGWPDERWLDIRRIDLLGPIMEKRLDLCRSKGFDAVEADNVDGYSNNTGFPLTAADQLSYNRFLAAAAHARGLGIGLKNDLSQVPALEPSFDFAVNEECFEQSECGLLDPFLRAGKAVFNAEYAVSTSSFCPTARAKGIMAMRKNLSLDAFREQCW